jgi:hypothetical protein
MFTSDQFRRAQAQHLTHPAALVDDHTRCTKCHDLSSDVEDGLCIGCRDEAADEESLGDCDVFAAVCDARRDGWIASMEAALSALSLGSVAA